MKCSHSEQFLSSAGLGADALSSGNWSTEEGMRVWALQDQSWLLWASLFFKRWQGQRGQGLDFNWLDSPEWFNCSDDWGGGWGGVKKQVGVQLMSHQRICVLFSRGSICTRPMLWNTPLSPYSMKLFTSWSHIPNSEYKNLSHKGIFQLLMLVQYWMKSLNTLRSRKHRPVSVWGCQSRGHLEVSSVLEKGKPPPSPTEGAMRSCGLGIVNSWFIMRSGKLGFLCEFFQFSIIN